MLAAALALVTSLCYGVANFVGPSLSRGLPVYPVLIAGQVVAFAVSGTVLAAMQAELPGGTVVLAAAAAGLGNALGLICFYRAASIGSLAVLLPVAAGLASGESLGALSSRASRWRSAAWRSRRASRAGSPTTRATSGAPRAGRCCRRSPSARSWPASRPRRRTVSSGR